MLESQALLCIISLYPRCASSAASTFIILFAHFPTRALRRRDAGCPSACVEEAQGTRPLGSRAGVLGCAHGCEDRGKRVNGLDPRPSPGWEGEWWGSGNDCGRNKDPLGLCLQQGAEPCWLPGPLRRGQGGPQAPVPDVQGPQPGGGGARGRASGPPPGGAPERGGAGTRTRKPENPVRAPGPRRPDSGRSSPPPRRPGPEGHTGSLAGSPLSKEVNNKYTKKSLKNGLLGDPWVAQR